MKKLYYLFTLLSCTLFFGQTTDLIISEYGEGTVGNSKYVEIYNGTGSSVDLAGYRIWTITNGGNWPEGTINLTGTLANGATFVVANNATDVPGADLYSGSLTFNGDDAVGLAKDVATVWTLIDAVGTDGADPGTGWDVAGITNATANNKLTRKQTICSPNTNWEVSRGTDATNSEWIVSSYTTGSATNGHVNTCSSSPSLTILSPTNGTIFNPNTTSVAVTIAVTNFVVGTPGPGIDGHIHYTINGGATVMKYDTTPINVPVTAGTSYTIAMQLVDNMHNPLSTPVTANVSFSVAGYTVVSNIGALRADVVANGPGNYYQITGEALVSYTRPATRNQKYIQDATGGILIDDNSNVITNTFNIGDGMINFRGQTSIFNGVLQIIPLENTAVNSTGNTITPQVVTVADLTAGNLEPYESKLVQINNVTFADGNGTNTFAVNTNYNISDGTTMAFRTIFAEADYVVNANLIPTGPTNIAVIVAEFNGTPQVVARNLSEITLSTNSFNAIDGLKMYPNPVSGNVLNLTSTANESMSVQIFDILGKEVVSANVINNQVNVSGLNAGVYIVKVTEAGKTATRKLVVK